jgi:hypothetical protein
VEAQLIDEPELEFGSGGMHPDLRFGVMEHGPSDRGMDRKPTEIKVAIVGTERSIEDSCGWIAKAEAGFEGSGSKKLNLFPGFPGLTKGVGFDCDIILDRSLSASVSPRDIREASAHGGYQERITRLTDLFFDAVANVAAKSPSVILVAMPTELLEEVVKAEGVIGSQKHTLKLFFHDLLKAKSLSLGRPLQLARPQTFGIKTPSLQKDLSARAGNQDEATRAWNFFSALYYKAGGFPWRLPRVETQYQTCFMGVAFLQSADKTEMHSSIAQVFNERGHGIAIKGRGAKLSEGDRQPHIAPDDVGELVSRCIKAFRDEHKTKPARLVVHKTSNFDLDELKAFEAAIELENIGMFDLLTLDRSRIRLYREGYYPPLRGSWITLDAKSHVLYTRGSVPFYEEYPGMYVPLSLLVKLFHTEDQHYETMRDLMLLSKLNWNNIQMDSTLPITISAARTVGSILRWVESREPFQREYQFFM